MNYLMIEGYMEAAESFSKEANLPLDMPLESIKTRMAIRQYIHDGQIDAAIDLLNDLSVDVRPKARRHTLTAC
jgi:glucose-induced degradation protein 8